MRTYREWRTVVIVLALLAVSTAQMRAAAVTRGQALSPQHLQVGYWIWDEYWNQSGGYVPVVSTSAEFRLQDGTYLGSHYDNNTPSPVSQGVFTNAASAVGGTIGYNFGADIMGWIFANAPNTYAWNYFGYYGIVAGPYTGLAIGAGLGFV